MLFTSAWAEARVLLSTYTTCDSLLQHICPQMSAGIHWQNLPPKDSYGEMAFWAVYFILYNLS